MARTKESGLLGKTATAASRKASGFAAEKAEEMASEALRKYGPTIRRRFLKGYASAKKNPVKSAAYGLAAIALLAVAVYALSSGSDE